MRAAATHATNGNATTVGTRSGNADRKTSVRDVALLVGVLTVLAAFSLTFLGLWVPRQDLGTGLLIAAAGITVFLLGRGVVVDGQRQSARRWWGWLYRPVLSSESRFSTIQTIEIGRKLRPTVPEEGVGRTLHFPSPSRERAVDPFC